MTRKVKVQIGSGNIFADLGLPDAEAHFLKAQIVSEICRLRNELKLTQPGLGFDLMDSGVRQLPVTKAIVIAVRAWAAWHVAEKARYL